jgi:hypothetical protein
LASLQAVVEGAPRFSPRQCQTPLPRTSPDTRRGGGGVAPQLILPPSHLCETARMDETDDIILDEEAPGETLTPLPGARRLWTQAHWWLSEMIKAFGEPADLAASGLPRHVRALLRLWLVGPEMLAKRLITAAALLIRLPALRPPRLRRRRPARSRLFIPGDPRTWRVSLRYWRLQPPADPAAVAKPAPQPRRPRAPRPASSARLRGRRRRYDPIALAAAERAARAAPPVSCRAEAIRVEALRRALADPAAAARRVAFRLARARDADLLMAAMADPDPPPLPVPPKEKRPAPADRDSAEAWRLRCAAGRLRPQPPDTG